MANPDLGVYMHQECDDIVADCTFIIHVIGRHRLYYRVYGGNTPATARPAFWQKFDIYSKFGPPNGGPSQDHYVTTLGGKFYPKPTEWILRPGVIYDREWQHMTYAFHHKDGGFRGNHAFRVTKDIYEHGAKWLLQYEDGDSRSDYFDYQIEMAIVWMPAWYSEDLIVPSLTPSPGDAAVDHSDRSAWPTTPRPLV